MRTVTMMLVVTFLLVCGLAVAAQQEGQPGSPTAPAVEGAPGSETGAVEGTPGAPTDTSALSAPGDSTDIEEEDKGNGGGNVDQNPNPNPQVVRERIVERRTQVVREIAAASQRGDQVAVKRLTTELGEINERIAAVEANPLGGTDGQRSMWGLLHDAGVVSESHLRTRYGLVPVSAPESTDTTPAPVPAAPQGQGGRKMTGTEILILAVIIGITAAVVAFALRGTRAEDLVDELRQTPTAAAQNMRIKYRGRGNRFEYLIEPANATPVIPPAPAPAAAQPAFPAAPLGVAYVPVQVTANPVTLNPAAPAQPAPAPAPVQPAPQPVQVWFNNNMGGQPAAQPQRNPQNQPPAQPAPQQRQPQAPQAQQPRQPRNQPRNQGPANPPAAGQGAPPAQGGGQGGNAPANP